MNEFFRKMLFLPEQGSTFAADIDHLHFFVILTTMVVSTAIGLSAFYFFFRYRRRRWGQTTRHIEPPLWFELTIIVVPLSFFLLWFVLGYREYVRMATPPPDATDVYVMAKKWMWKFAYPGGPNANAVLRVPARRPIRLLMTSRDVIHSFYVPAFRIKQDVLPGRYTETWFEAVAPGRYQILCAEYCGVGHSTMWGEVVAMEPEEFDAWIQSERRGLATRRDGSQDDNEAVYAAAPAASRSGPGPGVGPTTLPAEGRRLALELGCMKCHSVDGSPHIGPTWLDLYGRRELLADGSTVAVDDAYITESMMDPRARVVAGFTPVMPTFQGRVSPAETAALIEYIRTLRSDRLAPAPSERPVFQPSPGAAGSPPGVVAPAPPALPGGTP